MTTALELVDPLLRELNGWRMHGNARVDDRPEVPAFLVIRPDGTWHAEVATFTFADTVDLLFVSHAGGHFCGPAFVESSRADTEPWAMRTLLTGTGPLLVVTPQSRSELPGGEILDVEVVD